MQDSDLFPQLFCHLSHKPSEEITIGLENDLGLNTVDKLVPYYYVDHHLDPRCMIY